MGAQATTEVAMHAFGQEVDVHIAEQRLEGVRILRLPRRPALRDLQPVWHLSRYRAAEEPSRMGAGEGAHVEPGATIDHRYRIGARDKCPHDTIMWTKDGERVAMPSVYDRLDSAGV